MSVVALVLAGAVVVYGVVRAVLLAAHPEVCPSCSPPAALVSVGGPVVVAIAAGVAGLAVTVLRIVDRRPSWPFAVATLVFCAVAVGVGGYASAGYLAGLG